MNLFNKKGFTLIEVLVVLAILTILLGLSTVAVLNIQRGQILENNTWFIVSFLRRAQNQALNGVSVDGTNQVNFGIHFDPSNKKYILFQGNSFNAADPYNFPQDIPDALVLSTDLPSGNNVIFSKITGRVANFDVAHHQITLTHPTDGRTSVINFNITGGMDVQ